MAAFGRDFVEPVVDGAGDGRPLSLGVDMVWVLKKNKIGAKALDECRS
jgi:hypothetical protein